jgi:hypothetical protein
VDILILLVLFFGGASVVTVVTYFEVLEYGRGGNGSGYSAGVFYFFLAESRTLASSKLCTSMARSPYSEFVVYTLLFAIDLRIVYTGTRHA